MSPWKTRSPAVASIAPLPGTRPTSKRSISPVDRLIFAIPVSAFGSEPGRGITCQPPRPAGPGRRQIAAIIDVRNIQRVGAGMVSRGPVTARIPVTDDVVLAGLLENDVPVDRRLAGFHVDIGDHEVRIVVRKRRGPEKLAGGAIQLEDSAGFADRDRDVALLAALDRGIDPFHELRIGIQSRPQQSSFVRVIGIPIVAGQMLVIPGELAGSGIDRDGGIAVEIGRGGARNGVGIAVVARGRADPASDWRRPSRSACGRDRKCRAVPRWKRVACRDPRRPSFHRPARRARASCRSARLLCRSARRARRCSSSRVCRRTRLR